MKIQIYRLLERTKMAGPGWRFCIWVQGCSRRCEGCVARETWPHNGGTEMRTGDLFHQISSVPDIEGITFLGGEPFEQPGAVAALAKQAQAAGLSVVAFTGFTYEELLVMNHPHVLQLLNATDLLIDGPFIQAQFDLNRPWVGSANQRYRFLTDRYQESDLAGITNQIEVRIAPNGKTLVNGMGDFAEIQKLL
ncbi:MAG: radical SAM protein [Oscillospiraceae bacterium]|jgi:anaerobic ribonucleoside-triphosphate reductase activating protein|nr:radical SAM protein [Oscillospiraceae bacterium]